MLWILMTAAAAPLQVARNALQRGLVGDAGPWGATLVRFLFGLPFSIAIFAAVALATPGAQPHVTVRYLLALAIGAVAQIGAMFTAAMQPPDIKAKLAALGLFPSGTCGADFAAILRNDQCVEPSGGACCVFAKTLARNCGVNFLGGCPGWTLTRPTTPAWRYRRFQSEMVGAVVSSFSLMSL